MIHLCTLNREEWLRLLACLILGIIVGGACINIYTGKKLDALYYENRDLQEEVAAQKHRLDRLEENLADYRNPVIKEIEIQLISQEDKHMEQDIKTSLHTIVKPLIGMEVEKVDGALLQQTLDERLIKVGDKSFQIRMERVLLAPKTIFTIQAQRLPQKIEG